MKIRKKENIKLSDEEMVMIDLEEYPHASPCFPADISDADLKTKLDEWKTNQDEVDAINVAALRIGKPHATV